MRIRTIITDEWKFHLGDVKGAQDSNYDDSTWKTLDLPHDWSIEGSFKENREEYLQSKAKIIKENRGFCMGYLPSGVGWYRKKFMIPKEWEPHKLFIEFEGVYMNCDIWVNGKKFGTHPYGYTAFYFHLPKFAIWGEENTIAIRVDSTQMNTRWYSGAGIYRSLSLLSKPQANIGTWCTFITTPDISKEFATVSIQTECHTGRSELPEMEWSIKILDPKGAVCYDQTDPLPLPGNKSRKISQSIQIKNPELWGDVDPNLYVFEQSIHPKNTSNKEQYALLQDKETIRFGIRKCEFDPNKGFILNGKKTILKGVCNHHDLGCLGTAVNKRARQRQLEILKEMGCNAIRCSHNPPEVELLDLCDEMGFLVMDEAFDEWMHAKSNKGYHLYFKKWWKKDLTAMVKYHRNHPSIIMWSVGNELHEQRTKKGVKYFKKMKDFIHTFDTTRPITHGCNNINGANKSGFSDQMDVAGYNYFGVFGYSEPCKYDIDHEKYPNRVILGAETSSAVRTRGVYHFPHDKNKQKHDDLQCSSYDNCWVNWGNNAETCWKAVIDRDFVAGEFIWTGFDYIGEPTPYRWPAKSSYFGIIDTCGFPKDIYYFYKSQWTSTPTLHILPHLNWKKEDLPDGKLPVVCYTNCKTVELLLNGKSLGEKSMNEARDKGILHLEWMVDYEPGEIIANGIYIQSDGKERKVTTSVKTTDNPSQIKLTADRNIIKSDGVDLSFIEVDICDEKGNIVPNTDNLINFSINGPGIIAGVDNGNPISHEAYKANYRKIFNGKCLVVVQSTKESGTITLIAESEGMKSDKITINTA